MRRAGAIAMASGLAVIVGLSLSGTATAANKDALEMHQPYLHGDYGILVSASADSAPE